MQKLQRGVLVLCLSALCFGIEAQAADMLIPMGTPVGIQLNTDGVLVVDTPELDTESGLVAPARDAGLRAGDIILSVGGHSTATAAALAEAAAELPDGPAPITYLRGGQTLHCELTPVRDASGPRLGLWLRDGIAGVGTMTFYDPATHRFGALGHGVSDAETATMLPLADGSVCSARIVDVQPGAAGKPGALAGVFDMNERIGSLEQNCVCGIFGTAENAFCPEGELMPVAEDNEITAGPAYILSSVSDSGVHRYSVEISRGTVTADGRMLNVRVTDDSLLAVTGGIVQGMSGSPIIQNGKLVGAVTHVLVNDPTRGYGVTIRTMLAAADSYRPAA